MDINSEGKVTLYHKSTGATSEHHQIDAAAIVAADESEWSYERTSASSDEAEGEDLESLTKEELVDRAAAAGLTVTRGDGESGEPLKADYIKALKAR